MSAAAGGLALRGKVLSGLGWTLVRNWGNRLITLAVFVLLARLLEPAEFGLFAAAIAVLAVLDVLVEQGLGDAIVQRRELTTAQVNAAFYLTLGISTLAYLVMFAAAPAIERWMHTEQLGEMLRWAGLAMVVNAFGICQQAMLRREFAYKWLALRLLLATAVAGAVAALCAWHGLGAWSLVAQYLVFTSLNVGLLWLRPGWRPTLDVDARSVRPLLGYGANVLGMRLLEYGNVRFIELFVAWTLGPVALGIYMVAARVHQTLVLALVFSVLDVSLSAFARLAERLDEFGAAYMRATEAIGALVVPFFVAIALLAPELVHIAFGAKWSASAPVLQVLCIVGAFQALQYLNGSAISALGRPGVVLWLHALKAATAVATLLLSRGETLERVILAFAVGQGLAAVVILYIGSRFLHTTGWDVVRRLWPYVTACLAMAAVAAVLRRYAGWDDWPALARLVVLGAAIAATYLGVCRVIAPERVRALVAFVRRR